MLAGSTLLAKFIGWNPCLLFNTSCNPCSNNHMGITFPFHQRQNKHKAEQTKVLLLLFTIDSAMDW